MYLPNSSKLSLATQITSSHRLWGEVICVLKLNFDNFGRYIYFGHIIILLTERIWSPSTDYKRPKQGQNCPPANVRPCGVCSPMYTGLFIFYGPSQYLSSFPSNWPKSRNFFTNFSCRPLKNFGAACCGLNFDATDLPNS